MASLDKQLMTSLSEMISNNRILLATEYPEVWDTLLIDRYPPIIHRLQFSLDNGHSILLHKMFNTGIEKAIMHSHSWPFALKVLKGGYEMGIGYSDNRNFIPDSAFICNVKEGDIYAMSDENMFHYTRPITNQFSYSVMLIGERKRPRQALNNEKLNDEQKINLLNEFKNLLK